MGDHASERRLGKTRKSMDKNPIQGRPGWVSWHNTAKPFDLARQVNGAIVRGRTASNKKEKALTILDRFMLFWVGDSCAFHSNDESSYA